MTLTAFFLILFSVFLHVGWNFLSKRTVPSLAFYAISTGAAAIIWLPAYFLIDISISDLPPKFWLFWFGSVAFEFLYLFGLANAYKRSDMSLVYPLARAMPVLLTAAVTMVFSLGARPSLLALGGMMVVTAGCILMPLHSWGTFKWSAYRSLALFFTMASAIGTTGYTIIDSEAMGYMAQLPGDAAILLRGQLLFSSRR